MDKSCNTAVVEGMYVNWTFHRLDANPSTEAGYLRNSISRPKQETYHAHNR